MFVNALKAHIPIIAVTTDDYVNLKTVLGHWAAPRAVLPWPLQKQVVLKDSHLYFTFDHEQANPETYLRLVNAGAQMVVVNPGAKNNSMFDAGDLPTPEKFLVNYLTELGTPHVQALAQALKGLSMKAASEIVQLAAVTTGEITPKSVSSMRMQMNGATPGLYPLAVGDDFWEPQPEIVQWIQESKPYMRSDIPAGLQPKGLMLSGVPGTGKSMAAMVIARELGVPAYRLDVATTLNRYIGESESRTAKNLQLLTQYAPCVVLLDEVEKVFTKGNDSDTTTRMLSQFLWWLQARKTPVPVIMTTNNLSAIPPELYRDGRLDQVVVIGPLDMTGARHLALKVFHELTGLSPGLKFSNTIRTMFGDPEGKYIPATVKTRIVHMIKSEKLGCN